MLIGLGFGGRIVEEFCELRGLCVDRREQFAGWAHRSLGLPQRGAAIVAKRIERADVGQRDQLVAAQTRACDEVVDRSEAARRSCRRRRPIVRTGVAEPARRIDALEHRLVVAPALGAGRTFFTFAWGPTPTRWHGFAVPRPRA